MNPPTFVEKATAAWGEQMPEWILVLAEACDRTTQRRAAEQIGYAPSAVSAVIANKYKGDMEAVCTATQGAFMNKTVECPVLGEIPANQCLEYQRREFRPINQTRVMLYHACRRGCVNSKVSYDRGAP